MKTGERTPESALEKLREGNRRFVEGRMEHPRQDAARLRLAAAEDQGDHAFATILSCSDSRVPPELLFDTGVMDLFVIRVAGNVCNTDEIGCIEYGLCHVHTPVLVILGHTQCGAVTAVTRAVQDRGKAVERNIPPLVSGIQPAVLKAMERHPDLEGDAVIPPAIEENMWQAMENLFLESPAVRALVKEGRAKVIAASYDVGTGAVEWLPEEKTRAILDAAESNPARATQPMA
jgi:carbonic anhydrase